MPMIGNSMVGMEKEPKNGTAIPGKRKCDEGWDEVLITEIENQKQQKKQKLGVNNVEYFGKIILVFGLFAVVVFSIEVEINDDDSGNVWRLINLYASFIDSVRKLQWEELFQYRQQCAAADWMIWGDFNDLLGADEKQGGHHRETWSLKAFRDFVSKLEAVDVGFVGSPREGKGTLSQAFKIHLAIDVKIKMTLLRNLFSIFKDSFNLMEQAISGSSNTPGIQRDECRHILGFSNSLEEGKYLGMPYIIGRSKRGALKYIEDLVVKKVASWAGNFTNHAGREVLAKHVLLALPIYAMTCVKLLVGIC
ncbi:hypothetical protein Vadar_025052 [Vaccinium darrowii]|uniref:Uncharacterized protein n=1 Tax=Vaccinium darrowii TaxID=229202 RepID=A0ACB7XTC9_9ERIC|nr:hypothetical protein Vadar_025052 [Vaccinium darrowii]